MSVDVKTSGTDCSNASGDVAVSASRFTHTLPVFAQQLICHLRALENLQCLPSTLIDLTESYLRWPLTLVPDNTTTTKSIAAARYLPTQEEMDVLGALLLTRDAPPALRVGDRPTLKLLYSACRDDCRRKNAIFAATCHNVGPTVTIATLSPNNKTENERIVRLGFFTTRDFAKPLAVVPSSEPKPIDFVFSLNGPSGPLRVDATPDPIVSPLLAPKSNYRGSYMGPCCVDLQFPGGSHPPPDRFIPSPRYSIGPDAERYTFYNACGFHSDPDHRISIKELQVYAFSWNDI
jgi:hypothetical protein